MAAARQPDTLVSWLAAVVRAQGRRPALVSGEETWSYDELWQRAGAIARHLLHERGFAPGDRVALVGENEPRYLAAYLGILRAGCTAVPLNAMLDLGSMRAQVELVGASGTLVGTVSDEVRAGLAELLPEIAFADLPATALGRLPAPSAKTPACILLTSGSTGKPKGVVHTHGTLLHAALQLGSCLPFSPSDRGIAFLPFFAAIPEQVLPTLCTGGSLDVLPRFDPERVARAARGATTFDAVPTILARLLEHGAGEALRSLRWIMFASEPMPVALLERWWESVPGVETHQLYGMTEVLPMTFASDTLLRSQPATVGVPFPTSRLHVLGADGSELHDGSDGEIVCASPAMMLGYYGDPEATEATKTSDGSMLTGDLGRMDEAGRVFLTGRLKDIIISGGLNIAPAEIEAVACLHPGVAAAAVVGIPDPRWGETPVVVAVPSRGNGATIEAHEILSHCRQQLVSFKRPSAAALIDALPSTGIGKSAKSVIRQQILDGAISLVYAS
ncbi:MAG TPA: AMP-binding protein [Gaiellaceae bacterium]|nr:AMP-binding protein [Gaiellaceae bacterium]